MKKRFGLFLLIAGPWASAAAAYLLPEFTGFQIAAWASGTACVFAGAILACAPGF